MKNNQLISVIVPVYNIEAYLPRCLETIAHQSFPNLEIILVDDGSTDRSGAICDEFAEKDERAVVIHQENQGLWAARNSGQRVAHGDYLMYIDGDDYIHLDAIRVMYEAINQDGGYDLAIIDRKFTDRLDEDIEAPGENTMTELSQEDLITNLFTHQDKVLFIYQWNKLYRRKLVEDIWCREYLRSQDMDFNLQVYMKGCRAAWIHRELYFYVQRPTSLVKAEDAGMIYYRCRTDIFYQHFINLPEDKQQYAHFLLKELYAMMTGLKYSHHNTPDWKETNHLCKAYELSTRCAFWKNPDIPLAKKVVKTIQLHSPFFNWCVMELRSKLIKTQIQIVMDKITNNSN